MLQSPCGCCDFVVCGAAQTKPHPPRVAITMRTIRIDARTGRCMEPPCSEERKPALELERRSWIFLQKKRIGPGDELRGARALRELPARLEVPELNCRRGGRPD